MKIFIKLASVFILFTLSCYGQNKQLQPNAGTDSTSAKIPFTRKLGSSENNFPWEQKRSLVPGENYFLYYNPKIYSELKTQTGFKPSPENLIFTQDPLYYYKHDLAKMLALQYKEYNKYDLGIIGTYLGMSKKAFAIILAILSIK